MDEERDTPPPEAIAEALHLAALQQVDRMANIADGMRLQTMLNGFEAMLLDEEEETGRMPGSEDAAVRAYFQHLGMALHCTRQRAQSRVETARTLRDRLPLTWAVLVDGRASEQAATAAADQVEGLGAEHLEAYDQRAAQLVQEEVPTVIQRELEALRDSLDPEAANARHRTATNRRYVRGRTTGDGMGVCEIHTTAAKVAAMVDRIRRDAVGAHGRNEECRTLAQLTADRAADLILGAPGGTADDPTWPMDPLADQGITAVITVTMSAETATGATNDLASVAGMGTVVPPRAPRCRFAAPRDPGARWGPAKTARNLVAHTRMWTRAVIDPVDDAILAFDEHQRHIPAGLRRLIHARMPTCAGDDCGLPSHRTDLDHAIRYEHDGRTRHLNLHPLCRKAHWMKDEGFLGVRIDAEGVPRWGSKWGASRRAKVAFKAKPATSRPAYPEEPPF